MSAAAAGNAAIAKPEAQRNFRIDLMISPQTCGAVRAQTQDVLEEYLVVGRIRARLVLRVLEADAADSLGLQSTITV